MWRKALPVCKKKKLISTALISLSGLFTCLVTAQPIAMPSMPEMPAMPSISSESSFYTPSFPSSSFTRNDKTTKKDVPGDSKESILSDASSPEDVVSSLLGSDTSTLTASDISSQHPRAR